MVSNPSSSPNWTPGAFNGNLKADVEICALDVRIVGAVTTASCRVSVLSPTAAVADVKGEAYQLNWKVPSDSTTYYRITVKVGTRTLGWADVETASNASQLKNVSTNEYVPLNDGRTLPIKFRIENYALCATPGVGPCASGSVDLTVGGTVAAVLPHFTAPAGVTIPAQTSGGASVAAATTSDASTTTTITVTTCDDLNPRAVDLPTFGKCIRVTADPALSPGGLTTAATVFMCDVSDLTITEGPGGQVLDHDQADRITLHRLDPGPNGGQIVTALPHATACGGPTASRDGSLRGLFAALRHGRVHEAMRQVASLVSPKPLYAARFIDLGGGGSTNFFSDFQFALPARMEVVSETDGQSAAFGALLPLSPSVKVTDIGGAPVRNAKVRFIAAAGSASRDSVTTDENGLAQVDWTLGFTESNSLVAYGNGLAGTDVNGPRRSVVDPFQPIQSHFDPDPSVGPGGEVLVQTGTVSFSATGIFASSFEPAEPSWVNESTRGFWHTSALNGVTNTAFPSLVNAARDDNSNGALPAPFAGAHALWFGGDAQGNYAGDLASTTQDGGTSTGRRSGVAASPVFTVPAGPNAVLLSFQSWFEIESVNPSNFDVMQVSITDLDANSSALLVRLNPATDPGGNARTPLTSGGFNAPPVWVNIARDLSAYRGHRVQLTFSFDTGDALYNGFRGWVVDDVALHVGGAPASTTRIPLAHTDVVNTTPPPARTWHP